VRVSEIARIWGVSVSYVARLAKKGMPLDSVAEADAWRLENLQKPPRSQSGTAAVKISVEDSEKLAEAEDKDSSLSRLRRAYKGERMAFALLEELGKDANAVALRAAIHAYAEASRRASEAEVEHRKHQIAVRELLSTAEVKEKYIKHIGSLRALMDALPSSVCARANPSDPECAKQALEDGINQIYITIQKAEGAFA
jgi:hypothetical protein